MRISTLQFQRQAVGAITDKQSELSKTQLKIATGRRVLTPADDPTAAARILTLREQLAGNEQFSRNANVANNRLNLEESALGNVTDLIQSVRDRIVQGANGTLTQTDRGFLATELEQSRQALLQLANTRDANGEYIFAGNATLTEPFASGAGNAISYNGDQGRRELLIGPDARIAVGDNGVEVFQRIPNGNGTFQAVENGGNAGSGIISAGSLVNPGAYDAADYTIEFTSADTYEVRNTATGAVVTSAAFEPGDSIAFSGIQVRISGQPAAGDSFAVTPSTKQDLFTTVQNAIDALRTNTATAAGQNAFYNAIGRSLTDLDRALENTLIVRGGVGARLNNIEAEESVLADVNLFTESTLSGFEDLDFTRAASDLNLQLTALQASQQAFIRVQGLSLFNFL